jgi:transcription elongation factor Elf1
MTPREVPGYGLQRGTNIRETAQEDGMIQSDTVVEHRFTCPHCWEQITMLFDLADAEQPYVEDCEVCCNPISLRFSVRNGMVVFLQAKEVA